MEGENSRLDGLQAAVLRVKLRHLEEWNEVRRQVASWYDELLGGQDSITLPRVNEDAAHVFHLYVVQIENRDGVLKMLNEQGIGAGVHYPVPLHEQPVFAHLGYVSDDLPVTAAVAQRVLSLPLFPEMTRNQAERVAEALIAAVSS